MNKNLKSFAFLVIIAILMNFSLVYGKQFNLWGSQKGGSAFKGPEQKGNSVLLTSNAKIVRISRNADRYSVWRNDTLYISIEKGKKLSGVLPPGKYTLRTSIGSVNIYLETQFKPENITLWGRQNAIVKPLWEGNFVVLCAPTTIVSATYDGTKSMGIFVDGQNRAFLHYLSPHNIHNPGPKVFSISGVYLGETLVGQILPTGVYHLVPGKGTADGRVYGQIVLNAVIGNVHHLFKNVPKQNSGNFKSNRYNLVRIATNTWDKIPYHMTKQYNGTVTVNDNQKVILSGNDAGTKSWYVDNFLLFELSTPGWTKRFVIGVVDSVTYSGMKVPHIGPSVLTFSPDSLNLASQFPKGVPVNIRVSALDYGLVGGITDVYLIVK